jgi:hypothetical protein
MDRTRAVNSAEAADVRSQVQRNIQICCCSCRTLNPVTVTSSARVTLSDAFSMTLKLLIRSTERYSDKGNNKYCQVITRTVRLENDNVAFV